MDHKASSSRSPFLLGMPLELTGSQLATPEINTMQYDEDIGAAASAKLPTSENFLIDTLLLDEGIGASASTSLPTFKNLPLDETLYDRDIGATASAQLLTSRNMLIDKTLHDEDIGAAVWNLKDIYGPNRGAVGRNSTAAGTSSNDKAKNLNKTVMYCVVKRGHLLKKSKIPIRRLTGVLREVAAMKSSTGKRIMVVNVDEASTTLMGTNRQELPSLHITSCLRICETEDAIYFIDAAPTPSTLFYDGRRVRFWSIKDKSKSVNRDEIFSRSVVPNTSVSAANPGIRRFSPSDDDSERNRCCGLLALTRCFFKK